MLWRQPGVQPDGDCPEAVQQDSGECPAGGGGGRGGGLPAVPGQSGRAAGADRQALRRDLRPAHHLLHPAYGPGHGPAGEGARLPQTNRQPHDVAAQQGAVG